MKRTVLCVVFILLFVEAFAQRLSTVAVLPFDAEAGVSPYDASSVSRQFSSELTALEMANVLNSETTGSVIADLDIKANDWKDVRKVRDIGSALKTEYIIRGRMIKEGNQISIYADTLEVSSGKVLSSVKEQAPSAGAIQIYSLCVKTMERVPYPNYMIGKWQSNVSLGDASLVCIIEFKSDRSIVVERFDTYESRNDNSLLYYASGTGSYWFGGHIRRITQFRDRNGEVYREAPVDGSFNLTLNLDNALPNYASIKQERLYLIFGDGRNSFELPAAGLLCGDTPSGVMSYTRFSKISGSASLPRGKGPQPGGEGVSISPLWSQDLNGTVRGTPFLQAESAVVAVEGGIIKSYSRQGTFLWDYNVQANASPYVTRSREAASYVCNAAGKLITVNRVGRELWNLDLGRPISHPVLVGWDGRVFIPAGADLWCRTASGFPLWHINLGSPISVAPILDHAGGLAMVLENRDFVLIDQFSAAEKISLDRFPAAIVPLKDESLPRDQQNSYMLFYSDGKVDKINRNMGAGPSSRLSRVSFPALPAVPAVAAGRDKDAAVALRDGRVLLIAGDNGRVLWSADSNERPSEKGTGNIDAGNSSMTYDERGIFFFSRGGATLFNDDGRRIWMLHLKGATAVPSFSDEGILYSPFQANMLNAFKVENRGRNVPRSLYYGPEPEGKYGLGNPPPSPWANSPDKYREDNVNYMYDTISQATRIGQVGQMEPAYVGYIMEMTAGLLRTPGYSPVRPPVLPPQRVRLIRLLSYMGSRETISFLVNLINRDPEPSIKAACCEAIGRIGVDPSGEAIIAYNVLIAPDNAARDPQTLIAAVSSTAALSRFSGPPMSTAGIRLLQLFTLRDLPTTVKQQARRELDGLRELGMSRSQ
ncbi:MAG: PQQ-like beta-propeller repeat protein [Treponema sp.]|nr:PQQ-like beta-propeller repeat protein [Treponema sp.]